MMSYDIIDFGFILFNLPYQVVDGGRSAGDTTAGRSGSFTKHPVVI